MPHSILPGDHKSIATYYDQTWFDYRALWLNPNNRAIHFGYWDETTRSHSQSLLNMNRRLADNLRPEPGQLLLDAGCGVGGTSMWMAENYDVGAVGITITPSQAARAARYCAERGLTARVRFAVQDYCRTAFKEGTFDRVYGLESINYAMEKRDFIAEAFRVLKPGGRLVVQDGFKVHRPLSAEEQSLQESWLHGWMVPNLSSREEFAQWAEDIGFVNVEQKDCTDNVRRSCRRLYNVTMACYPVASALHLFGMRSDVQHGNVRAARDQWLAMEQGLWGYGIVCADKPA